MRHRIYGVRIGNVWHIHCADEGDLCHLITWHDPFQA